MIRLVRFEHPGQIRRDAITQNTAYRVCGFSQHHRNHDGIENTGLHQSLRHVFSVPRKHRTDGNPIERRCSQRRIICHALSPCKIYSLFVLIATALEFQALSGWIVLQQGLRGEAERRFRRALPLMAEETQPRNRFRPRLGPGSIREQRGELLEASKFYRDTVAIGEREPRAVPDNAGWQRGLSAS